MATVTTTAAIVNRAQTPVMCAVGILDDDDDDQMVKYRVEAWMWPKAFDVAVPLGPAAVSHGWKSRTNVTTLVIAAHT
ncbi:hypothetical protein [Nocardia sp. SC052]|uniref:hypothetical protein n=1 Tax=Nocardia sichangensis TaxID=3385975 RepID=UPI0039A0F8ED